MHIDDAELNARVVRHYVHLLRSAIRRADHANISMTWNKLRDATGVLASIVGDDAAIWESGAGWSMVGREWALEPDVLGPIDACAAALRTPEPPTPAATLALVLRHLKALRTSLVPATPGGNGDGR